MLEWEEAIKDLDDEEIARAVKKCKYTCEFINISKFRQAALDIVPAEQACTMINTNDLAFKAWHSIDPWFRQTRPEKELRKEFIANYNRLADKLLMGDDYD